VNLLNASTQSLPKNNKRAEMLHAKFTGNKNSTACDFQSLIHILKKKHIGILKILKRFNKNITRIDKIEKLIYESF
jgi:hypothetical protein